MARKKKKADGGLEIGGNVSVTSGDFVGGDKNVRVSKGGVFVGGNVQGSNIVTGNHNRVSNQGSTRDALFEEIIEKIEQRPETPPEDKEDLKANVAEIKAEAEKGEQADESFLARRLRNIERIAPDIAEVVLATLSNPISGIGIVMKKVVERTQKSANT
jgi:hypothetical protein